MSLKTRYSVFLLSLALLCGGMTLADAESDLAEARKLFDRNLDAIRQRDRDAYLACYWQSERLARPGPGGLQLGTR